MVSTQQKDKPVKIYYVVDNKGWVQHQRLQYLTKYQSSYRFKLLNAKRFRLLWKLRLLRKRPIFFSTWRIAHALIKACPDIFTEMDFQYFMAAVTSHSNIGGGLDPLNPIPGREPDEAFNLAVSLLKKFKIVTANSMILYELLSTSLPNLMYCPNGVDTNFFTPEVNMSYNPGSIRIGWVGKERGPKNYHVVKNACKELESSGVFKPEIIKVPKHFKKAPLSAEQMREFYRRIDFYLCASFNEGTPNPALEAGACGVPVVTTCVGNMRELIRPGENGFFIEPTVESIVEQFRKISQMNKEKYYQISKKMRNSIIHDWSWESRINNFVLAFNKLLDV